MTDLAVVLQWLPLDLSTSHYMPCLSCSVYVVVFHVFSSFFSQRRSSVIGTRYDTRAKSSNDSMNTIKPIVVGIEYRYEIGDIIE